MIARVISALLLACVLVTSGLSPAFFPNASAQSRPNFVVIVVDDLDSASVVEMPAVNRHLVDQGASFSRFFATTPLCCPSRASILRGQYAHNHGVLRNTGEDAGFAAFVGSGHESLTMATLLDDAGYETALVGKYLNGYTDRDDPTYVPPGWDFWAAGIDHAAYDGFGYEINVNGELERHGHDDDDYMTDVLAGHAGEFLAAATTGGAPFLLYLAPYAPHSPSTPAPRHRGSFAGASAPRTPAFNEHNIKDKPEWVRATGRMSESRIERINANYRSRLESLLAVDEMVDSVVRQLEQSGTLESTYIFFLSDNGYFLGEHRQPHGKDAPYDAASRIPLVLRGPDVPANTTVEALALNVDVMPTVLDLSGLNPPSFVDGRSLAAIVAGDDRDWRQSALLEGFGKETENLEGKESSTPPFRALRGEDVLYVEYETGERELYNLREDRFQLSNLARGTDKTVLRAFSRQLEGLTSCAGRSCQALENAAPPRVSKRSRANPREGNKERGRNERRRSEKSRATRSAPSAPTVEIGDKSEAPAPLRFALSRRDARSRQLRLRVHVVAVDAPGTLVAAVELPGSGSRERLSGVPVQSPGWLTMDIAAALGDTRDIAISLRGRDGAALSISGPDSSQAPELISEREGRPNTESRHNEDRGKRPRADRSAGDGPDRGKGDDRRRGR